VTRGAQSARTPRVTAAPRPSRSAKGQPADTHPCNTRGERHGTSKFSAVPPRSHTADAMAPKKAPAAAEPEPEPEAEAPPEPEEGEGIFYFPDNSKYGAPSTACTRMAAALCSGWCLCAHCTPAPAPQRACG